MCGGSVRLPVSAITEPMYVMYLSGMLHVKHFYGQDKKSGARRCTRVHKQAPDRPPAPPVEPTDPHRHPWTAWPRVASMHMPAFP